MVASSAVAADHYSLTWDANRLVYSDSGAFQRQEYYRHVRLMSTPAGRWSSLVCLGPAEWQVKGTLSNGKGITERWRATDWRSVFEPWRDDFDYDYVTTPGCANSTGWDTNWDPAGTRIWHWSIRPSGEYGALVMQTEASAGVYKNHWQVAASWPVRWTVVGCVYENSESECPFETR